MERIQHAIAKARAERAAQGPVSAQPLPYAGPAYGNPAISALHAPYIPPAGGMRVDPEPAPLPPSEVGDSAPVDPLPQAPARAHEEAVAAAWRDLPTLRVHERHFRRNLLVSFAGGPGSAEMDGIRTRLLQHLRSSGAKRIAITSPGPGCGKSTVALNLSFSLGRQPDQRTIVADVDLRRPHMAKSLRVKERHSFADVLTGDAVFAQNALRHGPNLAIATTHSAVRNSAELLQSRRAAGAISEIQAIYDPTVMLFDLPPVLANDDAMSFLGHVDAALIVAAAEKTTIREIDRCEREVASQTSVLGVVLNRCRYMERADGYSEYSE